MANEIDDYVVCHDDLSLADAIGAVKSSSAIALDCEGDELGMQGSSLSLICLLPIAPVGSSTAYFIDATRLSETKLRPLFDILEASTPTKVVFDGRMDFAELYHAYHVPINGVLDLQLADIASRSSRGETEDQQLRRLSGYLGNYEVMSRRQVYASVQRLNSLEFCVREHQISHGLGLFGKVVNHSAWMSRPLNRRSLHHASRDVRLIRSLYNHLQEKGYIQDHQLFDQSARYVRIHLNGKPARGDTYKANPLLPLQILTCETGLEMTCEGCGRSLPASKFVGARCFVCDAIYRRNGSRGKMGVGRILYL